MSDLFDTQPTPPLAEALRPQTLDDVVGQSHLLGDVVVERLRLPNSSLP